MMAVKLAVIQDNLYFFSPYLLHSCKTTVFYALCVKKQ